MYTGLKSEDPQYAMQGWMSIVRSRAPPPWHSIEDIRGMQSYYKLVNINWGFCVNQIINMVRIVQRRSKRSNILSFRPRTIGLVYNI